MKNILDRLIWLKKPVVLGIVILIGLGLSFFVLAESKNAISRIKLSKLDYSHVMVDSTQIDLPFSEPSENRIRWYVYEGVITKSWFSHDYMKIIADDYIENLIINGETVELEKIPEAKRSDWKNGFELSLSRYLKRGENAFWLTVRDDGGMTGLVLKNAGINMYRILSILYIILATGFLFVKGWNKLEMIGATDVLKKGSRMVDGTRPVIVSVNLLIILIVSFFTFFRDYDKPQSVFWDENYHIASSEKYLQGVMFMEPHPPLGKMLIALGEYIIHPNQNVDKSSFVSTNFITYFPDGYSFTGVRFMSTFFATLTPILFFFIFLLISKNSFVSSAFCCLYLFDNALIVHSRAAMIEGIQLFFVMTAVLWFVFVFEKRKEYLMRDYFVMGVLIGLAVSTKLNSAIIFLLVPFMLVSEYFPVLQAKQISARLAVKAALKTLLSCLGFFIVFGLVWQVHFIFGEKVANDQYYGASTEYKSIIMNHSQSNPLDFYVMLRDNWNYMMEQHAGTPKLDLSKSDENGSYPMAWPVGNKSINYRWEKNGNVTRYLYLQGNPLCWLIGLVSVILSISVVIARYIYGVKFKNDRMFHLILVFTVLYICYMAAVLSISRVMYLYHYFIPLLFAYIMAFLQFNLIFEGLLAKHSIALKAGLSSVLVLIFLTYLFFSPLTYYKPLTNAQFSQRMWFESWKLEPIK